MIDDKQNAEQMLDLSMLFFLFFMKIFILCLQQQICELFPRHITMSSLMHRFRTSSCPFFYPFIATYFFKQKHLCFLKPVYVMNSHQYLSMMDVNTKTCV